MVDICVNNWNRASRDSGDLIWLAVLGQIVSAKQASTDSRWILIWCLQILCYAACENCITSPSYLERVYTGTLAEESDLVLTSESRSHDLDILQDRHLCDDDQSTKQSVIDRLLAPAFGNRNVLMSRAQTLPENSPSYHQGF